MEELIHQLKEEGVLRSPHVAAAFRAIDRKDFVLPEYQREAYANYPLPTSGGQTISQPYTVAFMLDLLEPKPGEKILDVGAGSGWQTALLAHIVSQKGNQKSKVKSQKSGQVYAVERMAELCDFARANIGKYNFLKSGVVKFFCQDASAGLPNHARFDKIIAAASATHALPSAWRDQLRVGGTIVAPIGNSIWRYQKTSATEWQEEEFPGFAFVPLRATGESRLDAPPMHRRQNFLILTIGAAFLLAELYAIFVPLTIAGGKAAIEIPPGTGSRAIGELAKTNHLIRSKWGFVLYAALSGTASELKAGKYEFENTITIPELVERLARGDGLHQERVITVPEGWNLRDLGKFFEAEGMFPAEVLWKHTGAPAALNPAHVDYSMDFPFLAEKPTRVGLEGYLYPDTYRVFRGASAEDVIRRMLANFERKVTPELRAEIQRQGKTMLAVLTVASLIEKEIPIEAERRIAAGILWQRLRLGMPLQVDASVNYITGKHETPSAEDLAIDSPFNTYRSPGLPPGPIANPGRSAIRAAIDPAASPYLYYLSAPDGRTIFTTTLEEHNAAKRRYLR